MGVDLCESSKWKILSWCFFGKARRFSSRCCGVSFFCCSDSSPTSFKTARGLKLFFAHFPDDIPHLWPTHPQDKDFHGSTVPMEHHQKL